MSELMIVFLVVLVIWLGIGIFVLNMNNKVNVLEKEIQDLNEN